MYSICPSRQFSPRRRHLIGNHARKVYLTKINAAINQLDENYLQIQNNGDEERHISKIGNFSKGLPHNELGEVNIDIYNKFTMALTNNQFDILETLTLGGTVKLVNPFAGLSYEFESPDSQQLFLDPSPEFSSPEEAAEIGELYWQVLARDIPFVKYESNPLIAEASQDLSCFSKFFAPKIGNDITASTIFRGNTSDDLVGPYISQFLYQPIKYGGITIEQKYPSPNPIDYMIKYEEWLDIQNGLPSSHSLSYETTLKYIKNGRDLAEYVHSDFTFQAFLNACLIMLNLQIPFDSNNPYNHSKTQARFSTFGGPHILDLVTAIANKALKTAWFHKWFIHRRVRPEGFSGSLYNNITNRTNYPINKEIIESSVIKRIFAKHRSYLLPMSYPEGSPAHPAYPAGHAAIAGACVTVLKAFFEESTIIKDPVIASHDGLSLAPYIGPDLTIGGELNKLASNIALGRDFAGVHWRSDSIAGINLGEELVIKFLKEQNNIYSEKFKGFTLTKFDGKKIKI